MLNKRQRVSEEKMLVTSANATAGILRFCRSLSCFHPYSFTSMLLARPSAVWLLQGIPSTTALQNERFLHLCETLIVDSGIHIGTLPPYTSGDAY